jgi:heterodisulfide reductase subunit A
LVVGGGIAGMTAALTLADCGVQVDLVERSGALGGRLSRLAGTLEGLDPAALLSETTAAVERRPEITTHLDARVVSANGELGAYTSLLETADGQRLTLNHGAVVLAVGGREAATDSFGHGDLEAVMTQAEAESALTQGEIDPARTRRVVMIQCVDQRRPPRNLCGRVCCPTALKLADRFQSADPEAQVWIVYRDMMTTGFSETYFTRARRNGVRLVRYDLDREPKVAAAEDGGARVTVHDPILDRDLDIDADLVILGVGPRSALEPELAAMYGAELDADGFFAEADVKWRPVDGARDGVFGCGLALGPRNLASSAATGAAAAMRALRVLSRPTMRAARPTAATRPSLCALCLLCVDACPYQARRLDEENEFIAVNPALCQACGACAAACPSGAAVVDGMDDRRMFDVVEAALLRA